MLDNAGGASTQTTILGIHLASEMGNNEGKIDTLK